MVDEEPKYFKYFICLCHFSHRVIKVLRNQQKMGIMLRTISYKQNSRTFSGLFQVMVLQHNAVSCAVYLINKISHQHSVITPFSHLQPIKALKYEMFVHPRRNWLVFKGVFSGEPRERLSARVEV